MKIYQVSKWVRDIGDFWFMTDKMRKRGEEIPYVIVEKNRSYALLRQALNAIHGELSDGDLSRFLKENHCEIIARFRINEENEVEA